MMLCASSDKLQTAYCLPIIVAKVTMTRLTHFLLLPILLLVFSCGGSSVKKDSEATSSKAAGVGMRLFDREAKAAVLRSLSPEQRRYALRLKSRIAQSTLEMLWKLE